MSTLLVFDGIKMVRSAPRTPWRLLSCTLFTGLCPLPMRRRTDVAQGANVSVNGQFLGEVNDQFLRYTYELPASLLRGSGNVVAVTFSKSIGTDGRFMACTGGWDWASWRLLVVDCPAQHWGHLSIWPELIRCFWLPALCAQLIHARRPNLCRRRTQTLLRMAVRPSPRGSGKASTWSD